MIANRQQCLTKRMKKESLRKQGQKIGRVVDVFWEKLFCKPIL